MFDLPRYYDSCFQTFELASKVILLQPTDSYPHFLMKMLAYFVDQATERLGKCSSRSSHKGKLQVVAVWEQVVLLLLSIKYHAFCGGMVWYHTFLSRYHTLEYFRRLVLGCLVKLWTTEVKDKTKNARMIHAMRAPSKSWVDTVVHCVHAVQCTMQESTFRDCGGVFLRLLGDRIEFR